MLAVGRLVYYKGYLNLIEAMRQAPGKLLIIGRGPLEEKMKSLISSYNLSDRVIIIADAPSDIIAYYQASDFLVFPSNARSEAFGLVQIEAMACGRPVINTNLPTGVPEVSLDKQTGLTVPVGNVVKLAEAIKSLWEDEGLRLRLGHNALDRAVNNFSQEKFKKNLKLTLINIK
jgi:rhamnosyl/mannosyltransferase